MLVDAAGFDQAIISLASNARDAMPDGGTITVTSASRAIASEEAERHGAHAGCYAEVSVADTGAGIAAGVLGHIFDPFFTTKGPASTGSDWRRFAASSSTRAAGSMCRPRAASERRSEWCF